MKRAEGSWGLVEAMGAAVSTGDGTRLLLVSMRDVSDEKRSGEYAHHNQRLAELRRKAQETAETLRQLLVTIERGDTLTAAETLRAQALAIEPPVPLDENAG
jgi:hypothetical protein